MALRLGPWRSPVSRRFKQDTAEGAADSASAIIVSDPTAASEELSQSDAHHRHLEAFLRCKMLLGWGSNEHRQLGMSTAVTHPDSELQATCAPVSLEGVSSRGEFPQSGPTSKLPAEMSEETSSSSTSISAPDFDSVLAVGPQRGNASRRGMVAGEIQHSQVLCGVGYSAFLGPTRVLSLWGKSAEEYVLASVIPAAVGTGTAAEAEGGVLRSAKVSRAPGENERTPTGPGPVDPGSLTSQSREGEVIAISDVVGAALGYEHMLLLSSSGWVVAVGDNYWGQCLGPESFLRVGSQGLKSRLRRLDSTSNEGSYTANMPPAADADSNQTDNNDSGPTVKVLKLAAGVRHSAAVTVDGFLHVWGTGSAAHIALESDFSVHEPSAANGESSKAVGAESNGSVVIKAGSARTVEQGRRPSVSDTAARQPSNGTAVSATAEAKSSAAMGTAAHAGSASTQVNEPWCPLDAKLIDVSCGLHHTVAVDERGRVWSFGDDKFGSLGRAVPGSTGAGRAQTKDSTPRLVDGLERGVRWQRVRQLYSA